MQWQPELWKLTEVVWDSSPGAFRPLQAIMLAAEALEDTGRAAFTGRNAHLSKCSNYRNAVA
jgi:hypothetical protein